MEKELMLNLVDSFEKPTQPKPKPKLPQPKFNKQSINIVKQKDNNTKFKNTFDNKQQRSETQNKKAEADFDDFSIRGADDNEDEDVSSAVASLLARDKKLQEETGPASYNDGDNFVEFDEDEPSFRKKKRRLDGKPQPAKPSSASTVKFKPGQLMKASQFEVAEGATWVDLKLESRIVQALETLNFKSPTNTQRSAIPILLAGHNALVKAPTGSGKTLAFLLPMLHDLQSLRPQVNRTDGTLGIAIAPTRELCIQIFDVASALLKQARMHWIVAGMLIGGENRAHEKARLRKGVAILAASPGRLLDHLTNTASFKTEKLRWLVLDEADRLLDLGFEAKLKDILGKLKERQGTGQAPVGVGADSGSGSEVVGWGQKRRSVLLSATLHRNLSSLAQEALENPVAVGFSVEQGKSGLEIKDTGKGASDLSPAGEVADYQIPSQMSQLFVEVEAKDRLMTLAALLKSRMDSAGRAAAAKKAGQPTKILVFLSCCDSVEFHHHLFADIWPLACGGGGGGSSNSGGLLRCEFLKLHGNMVQAERTGTFCKFAKGGDGVLFCTDVAARGLDFANVSCIVQYDTPCTAIEYVHRVGRTARAGSTGEAILFLMPCEKQYLSILAGRGVTLAELKGSSLTRHLMPAAVDLAIAAAAGDDVFGGKRKRGGGSGSSNAHDLTQHVFWIQRQLMHAVSADEHAKALASSAFRSHVRAYATHGAEARKVFHVRNLHLGHVAFSFCLKEAPGRVGSSGSAQNKRTKRDEAQRQRVKMAKKKVRAVSGRLAGVTNG